MASGYGSGYAPAGRLPLGVAILSVLIGIVGFLFVLVGIFALIGTAIPDHYRLLASVGVVASLVTLLGGILLLVVAGGLWNQELWALALAVLVLLVLVVWNVLVFLGGGAVSLLWVTVEVLLLVYLVAVRSHFD